jgi:hypothetical protein
MLQGNACFLIIINCPPLQPHTESDGYTENIQSAEEGYGKSNRENLQIHGTSSSYSKIDTTVSLVA